MSFSGNISSEEELQTVKFIIFVYYLPIHTFHICSHSESEPLIILRTVPFLSYIKSSEIIRLNARKMDANMPWHNHRETIIWQLYYSVAND